MPLTGVECVNRVYTDHAVFDVGPGGAVVRETWGISLTSLRDVVAVPLNAQS